jgi:hypothetical protein
MPHQIEVNPNPQPAPTGPGDPDFDKFWLMRCGDYLVYEIEWHALGTRGYLARSDGGGWCLSYPETLLPDDDEARLLATAYAMWRRT